MFLLKDIKKVAIYNRISRENNETEDILFNHRTITTRLCETKVYDYKLYEEVESGGKFEERTKLLQLLKDLDEGLFDGLVVVELSRLARNNLYSQIVAETLVNNDVPVITPSRIYDLDDESDRLMYDLESMMSSKELRTITRRMKVGKIERAKRGEWIQGRPPLGYRRNNKTRLLEIYEPEAEIVRYIFNLAEKGHGVTEITKQLTIYKTRDGNSFNASSVYKLLTNTTYTGTIKYEAKNKRGEVIESVVKVDSHEPIVPLSQFNSVQSAIQSRMSGNIAKRNRSKGECLSILKDLVYCKVCGLKMGIRRDSKRKESIYVNKCKCGNKGITEKKLVDEFWEELSIVEKQLRQSFEKALDVSKTQDTKESLNKTLEELNKQSDKVKAKLRRVRDAYTDGVFTKEEYITDKMVVEKELTQINKSVSEITQKLKQYDAETISKEYETKLKWLSDVRELSDMYNNGELFVRGKDIKDAPIPTVNTKDITEVNRLLKLVINKVYYHRYDEETTLNEDGYVDTEKGDFIRITVEPK
ncbi:recombinase family protein [Bacillus sp. RO1]|nr:recombinase family protein [Bacillus sp. RO1]